MNDPNRTVLLELTIAEAAAIHTLCDSHAVGCRRMVDRIDGAPGLYVPGTVRFFRDGMDTADRICTALELLVPDFAELAERNATGATEDTESGGGQ